MRKLNPFLKILNFIIFTGLLIVGSVTGLYGANSDDKDSELDFPTRFRLSVIKWFPDEAAEIAASYGLHYANRIDSDADRGADNTIVLIHGLDDPGKVWMNLAPALISEGLNVWTMTYPNDQPIRESARFFKDQLLVLHQMGAKHIAIVAHSMGGLVTREMLTNPDIGYDRQVQSGELPRVKQLIMVATPNHGSRLARFRFLSEIREQVVRLTDGSWNWLGWIMDGAGEAKTDLLPESRFLNDLNTRPHPPGVKLLVIAGAIGHPDEKEIRDFIGVLEASLPEDKQALAEDLTKWLEDTSRQIGDGLVTVESALLPGVPHQVLPGTHLSVIRNIMEDSKRIPPALPIILETIAEK